MKQIYALFLVSVFYGGSLYGASGRGQLEQMQQLFHDVANRVTPSVVHIETIQDLGKRRKKITGSGYIWDKDGHIVTNEHVVARAAHIEVRLLGQTESITATVLGSDSQTDLALLKIDKKDLPSPLVPARDGAARVGDWVLAIGNPYGLDGSVSFGIISARSRNIGRLNSLSPFLQTDAMIDFGSSGGPLVNMDGEVVGVNSMGQGRGIGFTIPIATVRKIVDRLRTGEIDRGWLGVVIQPLPESLRKWWKLAKHGVIVNRVLTGSPAAKSGLQVGDVISSVDTHTVDIREDKDIVEFRRLIADSGSLSHVMIGYSRRQNGLWHSAAAAVTLAVSPPLKGRLFKSTFGFTAEDLTISAALKKGATGIQGVMILQVEPGTPAAEAQLGRGDIIESVNGLAVASVTALQAMSLSEPSLLQIWRQGNRMYLLVEPLTEAHQEAK